MALLFTIRANPLPPPDTNLDAGLRYIMDPAKKDSWTNHLMSHASPPLPFSNPPTTQECDAEAEAISADFAGASEAAFDKRKGGVPKGSPWWDAECDMAAQAVHAAPPGEAKDIALATLCKAVRKAKRSWADGIIRNGNLWEAAKWRHGRHVTKIPSVQGRGDLVHAHNEMANIFQDRFFGAQPPAVQTDLADDQPTFLEHDLHPLSEEEVDLLLAQTNNSSAPGPSGQGWRLIKWAWNDIPGLSKRLVHLFNACISAGYHPTAWRKATVVVIPKPNRADYSLPKNYRPIALLECLGKLLEKSLT